MKLKKIASLMLAGIMAVSMLAGCKSGTPDPNPGEGEQGDTTSSFTQSVLNKVNNKTGAVLVASENNKMDVAVQAAAEVDKYAGAKDLDVLTMLPADQNWKSVTVGQTKMGDAAFFEADAAGVNFSQFDAWDTDNKTWWTMGLANVKIPDDALADMIAGVLDQYSNTFLADSADYDYTYSVRIAKATCDNSDFGKADDDYTIVGVAITCEREKINKY